MQKLFEKKSLLITAVIITLFLSVAGEYTFGETTGIKPGTAVIESTASADYNAVKITWKKVDNANKYQVYRSAAKNGKYILAKTTTSTTFTNKGLQTGKTYYFKVRAVNSMAKGDFSVVKSAEPKLKKASIKNLTATKTSVKLQIQKVNGATKYQIYRSTSKDGSYNLITKSTGVEFTDKGLSSGKTYYYKVRAVRTIKSKTYYGAYSDVKAKATKSASTKPGTVTMESVASDGYNAVKVTWKKADKADKYQLYNATAKNGTYSLVKTTKSTTYVCRGLQTGKTYYFKVRGVNSEGNGAYSAIMSAAPKLSAPKIKTLSASINSVQVSWSRVNGASGYQLYRSATEDGTYTRVKTTDRLTHKNKSLSINKKYYYKVRAYRLVGDKKKYSAFSPVKNVTTKKKVTVKVPKYGEKNGKRVIIGYDEFVFNKSNYNEAFIEFYKNEPGVIIKYN